MNCSLNRDIIIGAGGCSTSDINIGIQDGIYIYNLEDVKGLVFENDSRPDTSLLIDTVITSGNFYIIDATSVSFSETYNDHYYSESLSFSIASVRNRIEEKLQGAVHGKYLVAFRVIGEENYRLAGWKEGLSFDEELSIASDSSSFQITLSGNTTYPIMEVDKSNFHLSGKTFEPTFEPLFMQGSVTCSNGWATAMYAVKVNAAGQALDEDNKLCQYSGKRQDAYKLSGVSDGGYHIIGTYGQNDYIEGKPVRTYNTSLCGVSGSLSVSPSSITLNSTTSQTSVTVTSSNDWEVVSHPSVVTLSRYDGSQGSSVVYIYGTNNCGSDTITFRNRVTKQTANVTVKNDILKIGSTYTYPNGTTSVTLQPVVCGNYNVDNLSEGSVSKNNDGTFTIRNIGTSTSEKRITFSVYAGTETKRVTLIIKGSDSSTGARVLSEWCEVN